MKIMVRRIDGSLVEADSSRLEYRISTNGVIVRDGKVCIIPQFDGYDFPGGKVEKGEDHLEALAREIRQETGLDTRPSGLIGNYTTFFERHDTHKLYHQILLLYFADIVGGKLNSDNYTNAERSYARPAAFVGFDELKKLKFLRYFKDDEMAGIFAAIGSKIKARGFSR